VENRECAEKALELIPTMNQGEANCENCGGQTFVIYKAKRLGTVENDALHIEEEQPEICLVECMQCGVFTKYVEAGEFPEEDEDEQGIMGPE